MNREDIDGVGAATLVTAPERRFGRYVIKDVIGRGGMGVVYRAHDPKLDRTVALKVIHRAASVDDDGLQRFVREARAIANLTHPAIVNVYDFGEDAGEVFIVMELVAGPSLRKVLTEQQRLPWRAAVRIASQVADALARAHANGWVHRDIKPDNILLTGADLQQAKVTDFGIAGTLTSTLTMVGSVMGTPAYMPPEQWRGEKADPRNDVFSLAVVTYEMLTGSNPFRGDGVDATRERIFNEHPAPVRSLVPDVPSAVEALVVRALSKDRNGRFDSCKELMEAIAELSATYSAALGDSAAFPPVRLLAAFKHGRQSIALPSCAVAIVGSDAGSDVVLREPSIQPNHARFTRREKELWIEPFGNAPVSVNGHVLDGAALVEPGDWLKVGDVPFQVAVAGAVSRSAPASSEGATPSPRNADHAERRSITIGRQDDCDVAIPSPIVSRRHARILREGSSWILEDLGSTNGTFVDGNPVRDRFPLKGGETVQFGSYAYRFEAGELRPVEGAGRIAIEARQLRKTVKDVATGSDRDLLQDVDLVVRPGEFVGIFGMSGSGKSTLLDALNGRRPATSGSVLYNGTDLYRSFDLFKSTIGYVPQQDIVHRRITIAQALGYTARLRLPPDTSATEIDTLVARVLERVGLGEKAHQPIDTPAPLSGGQLKRVSLASELVANPSVLFLDEATSGLDAGTDKRMMRLFADLAADGRTVACVTHTLENVDACDLVAVLYAGRLVYFGPPEGVQTHFGIRRLPDVYDTLERAAPEVWADRFARSSFHHTYVAERLAASATAPTMNRSPEIVTSPPRMFDFRQARLLVARYVTLIAADRRNLLILLAQAPLIALVIGLVFDTSGALPERAKVQGQVSFMLVIAAIWFGCLNAAREIVKEQPVYLRERAVNLGIAPYLASKAVVLCALCVAQCLALVSIVAWNLDLGGDALARAAVLVATGVTATAMGLTVSALVASADKAIAMVPLLLLPQVILSGAIVKLGTASEAIARASVIAFWGYEGMQATLAPDVRALLANDPSWGTAIAALGAFFVVFVACAAMALRMKGRG